MCSSDLQVLADHNIVLGNKLISSVDQSLHFVGASAIFLASSTSLSNLFPNCSTFFSKRSQQTTTTNANVTLATGLNTLVAHFDALNRRLHAGEQDYKNNHTPAKQGRRKE